MIQSMKSLDSSDAEFSSNFKPINDEQQPQQKEQKKYAIIDQNLRVQLLKTILSKKTTIKEAAKQFGINFSTAKAILQTYRKEGRIGKKKTRDRNRKDKAQQQQDVPTDNTRKVQSMYDLEKGLPSKPTQVSSEFKQPDLISEFAIQQQFINPQQRTIMSSPNLDENHVQIALALCQRQLAQQKMINMQLLMMIKNMQQDPQQFQTIVKEEANTQY